MRRVRAAFEDLHEERYGYRDADAAVEVVTIRVTARMAGPQIDLAGGSPAGAQRSRRAVVFGGREHDAEVVRGDPLPGEEIAGPAICELPEATLAVPPGWTGVVDDAGTIVLERAACMTLDPIDLQVVTGALRAACEEMGAALVRSAHSANIKERRDCSSGLFDAAGEMVMQAEHIPVHLGAMPAAVAAVLGEDHSQGRPWILNDPFRGGTHLPDITVITPVLAASGDLLGFAANRAHHADVGGRVPGSMPADSTTLAEEGVVIAPRVLDDAAIDELSARMRQPDQRRADLRAQLAANRLGARRLLELAERLGADALREATAAVLDYAERRTRACIAALPDGAREARDVLEGIDGDIELRLRAIVDGDRLMLDFAGSAPPARRQPQLPARSHPLGRLLRRPRADRPRRAAERGRLPPDRGARARPARC